MGLLVHDSLYMYEETTEPYHVLSLFVLMLFLVSAKHTIFHAPLFPSRCLPRQQRGLLPVCHVVELPVLV